MFFILKDIKKIKGFYTFPIPIIAIASFSF